MGLGGYTEYHASQIGFAELLGAPELKSIKPFSMSDIMPLQHITQFPDILINMASIPQ